MAGWRIATPADDKFLERFIIENGRAKVIRAWSTEVKEKELVNLLSSEQVKYPNMDTASTATFQANL